MYLKIIGKGTGDQGLSSRSALVHVLENHRQKDC